MSPCQDQLKDIAREKLTHKQAFSRLYRFQRIYSNCEITIVGLEIIAAVIISVIVYNNQKEPISTGETVLFILGCIWYSLLAVSFLYFIIFSFLRLVLFSIFKVNEETYRQFNKKRQDFLKRVIDVKKSMKREKTDKAVIGRINADDPQDSLPLDEQLKKVNFSLSVAHKTWPNYKRIQKIKEQEFGYMMALGFLTNLVIATLYIYNSGEHFYFWKIVGLLGVCFCQVTLLQ